jgi:hypothetical protein
LEPEVAGELGTDTTFNYQNEVEFLHYDFHGWLGDELLEATPCFIVTENLAMNIQNEKLGGAIFKDLRITPSPLFNELYPDQTLPTFKHMVIFGKVRVNDNTFFEWSGDDFCLSNNSYLVVTNKALEVLKMRQFNYCNTKKLSAALK